MILINSNTRGMSRNPPLWLPLLVMSRSIALHRQRGSLAPERALPPLPVRRESNWGYRQEFSQHLMCPVLSLQPLMKTDRHTGRFSGGQTDSKRYSGRQRERQTQRYSGRRADRLKNTDSFAGRQAGRKTDRWVFR